ncbi:serine-type D-Ala-D-Ala carboxypeptidase [Mycoplasma sp. CAG:776]|nr:serine-type D-Ala-D-Ala carboxypeptidase [Mycoplasma sp. CAG:776]
MKKIALFLFCFFPIYAFALEIPNLNSEAVIVYDMDADTVIFDKNSQNVHSIASLTKIMTVLTAIENIDDFSTNVTITNEMLAGIYWNASVAGLKVGDIVTYRDLLYAAILPSGADATQVLAYTVSGSVDTFVYKMNELAKKIGVKNTHYVNTTGLDQDGAYSTAYDQMLILDYALQNSMFKEVYTTKEYTLTNGLKVEASVQKYNQVLNLDTSKIIGSKTGNTDLAGLCMSALFYHEDHEMILITLGAERIDDLPYNLIDTLTIIDTVNQNYEIPVNDVVTTESVFLEKEEIETFNIPYEVVFVLVVVLFLGLTLLCRRKKK